MGNACGICKATTNPAGASLPRSPSAPLAMLSGGTLEALPGRRTVVGHVVPDQMRPRAVCGMPYTVDANAVREANEDLNTALGCATGARDVVAVAPAGCACSGTVAPELPSLLPVKATPTMTTAPAAGTDLQNALAQLNRDAQRRVLETVVMGTPMAPDLYGVFQTSFGSGLVRDLVNCGRQFTGYAPESKRMVAVAMGARFPSMTMWQRIVSAIDRGSPREEVDRIFQRIDDEFPPYNLADVVRAFCEEVARVNPLTQPFSSPTLAKYPVKGAGSPLGLIAPALRAEERRYAGAGIPAPIVAGSPPSSAVPVMGAFTQSQCHQPASWYASPPPGAYTNCYAANADAARQAEAAARGGSSGGGSTSTGPVTSEADCTGRGGTVYQATNPSTGQSQAACLLSNGTTQWIGSGGQSDVETAQIVGSIAAAVGTTAQAIIGLINNDRNRELAVQLENIRAETARYTAALNRGDSALASQYQQQAQASQNALIQMLLDRMGNQQQGSFQQMLPMLAIVGLALGGAYALTRR